MELIIHPHLFNPLYWHIEEALQNNDIRHIFVYGGSSAAKTYTLGQNLLLGAERDNYSCLVFRKEQASIPDTIYNDFREINDNFQLDHQMQEFKIKLVNGQIIRFRGVDKSGKVKGLKGYKKLLLDELDHFVYDDFKEFKRRLRGEDGQQLIYTWNPIYKEHWIKEKVLDNEKWIEQPKEVKNCPSKYSKLSEHSNKWINERGDSLLIKTNHLDNYWVVGHPDKRFGRVDKHAINEFEVMKKIDPEDYRVYALGEWGNPKVEQAYITTFEKQKHVSELATFKENKNFIMSFDFNIDNTSAVFAHIGVNYIHFFDEMTGKDLPQLLEKIKVRYGKYLANCYVTGDRSGQNRTHLLSDNMNSYRMIKNTLKLSPRQFKVIVNPPHKDNRVTCNTILAFHDNVLFNPKCEETIYDIMNVECDDDGKIIKKDRSVSNQKADKLDCFRYILNTFKRKWVKNYRPQ